VGTEVSAKYKGAFCEAKVKKVMRQVKCRVTFKQVNITFVRACKLLNFFFLFCLKILLCDAKVRVL